MRLVEPCLKAASLGLVAGCFLALILCRSVWLEMRINIGHVIPITMASFVLFLGARKRPMRLSTFLLLELLTAVLLLSAYGFSSSTILIVPAVLFREGFHLSFLSLPKIDVLLLCFLGTANALWIYAVAAQWRRNGRMVSQPLPFAGRITRSDNRGSSRRGDHDSGIVLAHAVRMKKTINQTEV